MSKNSNSKKTRSRSPEKKAAQFEKILEAGIELFIAKGWDGFSLRSIAKNLGMNQNNIYNYVMSKRELWIAIRHKFYNQLRDENIQTIKNHDGSTIDLLLKLFDHFLEFAEQDFGVFLMMHNLIDAPPSDKLGPFEKEYREFKLLDGTTRLLQKAIDNGEISTKNAALLSFFTYGLLLGTSIIEKDMRIGFSGVPIQEYIQFGEVDFTHLEFRSYVIKIIKHILKHSDLSL